MAAYTEERLFTKENLANPEVRTLGAILFFPDPHLEKSFFNSPRRISTFPGIERGLPVGGSLHILAEKRTRAS